ncbi:MAG: hypothetical protein LCI00_05040 [Chloroflexi bacterium]|nr:hypothetical protein [Chloroflexota bacterium]MCC6896419.1 hypothetical protein [Anaerolineae bacterium]
MPDNTHESLARVQKYQQLVLAYEALDQEIDGLIMAHGGSSEKMPEAELNHYRELARQRDDLQGEMHELEIELNIDEA